MFSFIEVPLLASRHFSMIFIIKVYLEEDVFIRRKALKNVHCLLTFLGFKVDVYVNLRVQIQETDELIVTPPLSPSCEGYMHFLNVKKEGKWHIKLAKEDSSGKVFIFQKRKRLQL